jgi:hypothetical protein
MKDLYTVGELAARITGGNEKAMRQLLNDAGADPKLDEYVRRPEETVTRTEVIDLAADRAGDRVSRICADFLRV